MAGVLPLKDTTEGYEEPINPLADELQVRGVHVQSAAGPVDAVVAISRDGAGNMTFIDANNTVQTLTNLAAGGGGGGITEAQHNALRSLAHYIDEGPTTIGFNNAYREVTGTAFPTAIIWWTSSGKTNKIVELVITRDAGQKPTTEVWKVFDGAGATLITVTDTITYTGAFEASRARAIA